MDNVIIFALSAVKFFMEKKLKLELGSIRTLEYNSLYDPYVSTL